MVAEQSDLEWTLVDVVSFDQIGTTKRVGEKVDQICKFAKKCNAGGRAGRSHRDAMRVSQAIAEKDRALVQVRRLERQLASSRERERAADIRIQETQEMQEG